MYRFVLLLSALRATDSQIAFDPTYYDGVNKGLDDWPTDIQEIITFVDLQLNSISYLERVPYLPNLSGVSLSENGLSNFPDFEAVGGTLAALFLNDNNLTEIPVDSLIPLTSLVVLAVSGNPLVSLPNFGLLPASSSPLDVGLDADQLFSCDRVMASIKAAEQAGRVGFSDSAPVCGSPGRLVGVGWENMTVGDLVANVTTPSKFVRFAPHTFPLPPCVAPNISAIIPQMAPRDCARLCFRSPGCAVYAHDDDVTGCVLTSLETLGSGSNYSYYSNWKVVK